MPRTFQDPQKRYFEFYKLGDRLTTRRRTVEMADILNFASLTGDFYPLHIDEVHSKQTQFKSRIAHGPLTFSLAVGLVGMTGFYGDAIVALKEITGMRATAPVLPGDTIHVEAEVVELNGSGGPKYGILTVRYNVLNQRAALVMTFLQTMLARKKPLKGEYDEH